MTRQYTIKLVHSDNGKAFNDLKLNTSDYREFNNALVDIFGIDSAQVIINRAGAELVNGSDSAKVYYSVQIGVNPKDKYDKLYDSYEIDVLII